MAQPVRWQRNPKPDESVIKLTEAANAAAHNGQVRLIGTCAVNPNLEVEFDVAGDLDPVKRDLLIGGLTRLINRIAG